MKRQLDRSMARWLAAWIDRRITEDGTLLAELQTASQQRANDRLCLPEDYNWINGAL